MTESHKALSVLLGFVSSYESTNFSIPDSFCYDVRDNRQGDYRDDRRQHSDDDDLLNERPLGFTCLSSSNSIPFIGEDTMQLLAKTNAIRACQASGATKNAECAANNVFYDLKAC